MIGNTSKSQIKNTLVMSIFAPIFRFVVPILPKLKTILKEKEYSLIALYYMQKPHITFQ